MNEWHWCLVSIMIMVALVEAKKGGVGCYVEGGYQTRPDVSEDGAPCSCSLHKLLFKLHLERMKHWNIL